MDQGEQNRRQVGQLTDIKVAKDRLRGIYLLPNLLTTCALLAGFYAIVAAQTGDIHNAAFAVLIAMILDGLDGRIARLTNTQSEFGAEYDSFSDLVSFGLAPALALYQWSLHLISNVGPGWAQLGWIAAFFYTVMTAMRLARFNSSDDHVGARQYFHGLPSPTAAALVVGFMWFCFDNGISPESVRWITFVLMILAGGLMMSDIKYHSFKDIDFKRRVPVFWLTLVVPFLALLIFNPPAVLFFGALIYTLSGLIRWLWQRRQATA